VSAASPRHANVTARLIDGRALAASLRTDLARRAAALAADGVVPGLAVILVGDDPASAVYVRNKIRACEAVGIRSQAQRLPANINNAELLGRIVELNADPSIHGILVQLPLPPHIDMARVLETISVDKDVDGFHHYNVGGLVTGNTIFSPCTPFGVIKLLESEGIELVDSTCFLQDSLPQRGTLTRREPSKQEREDIAYGLEIAREIARLDLGQTIVVRGQACVAIEAMEGTDETIRRAGKLARGRLTVVKVAKPNQDMRFDVPVVGVPTIEAMKEAGATCLCITAGKTLYKVRTEIAGFVPPCDRSYVMSLSPADRFGVT